MMRALLTLTDQGARVELSGHASDARACASISTVCSAVMNALGVRIREETARYKPGDVYFAADRLRREDRAVLCVLAIALVQLSEIFPSDVDVTLVGDWDV